MIIQSKSTDPYFNIAAEEYLLKNYTDDVFMLYRNEPSVIVGKHQNTLAEIDLKSVNENGIVVVRRLSGGGAVYHDLGNLNFTFIKNGTEGKLVNFKGFTKPIIDALAKLGVNAKFEGHNSIMVNGKKISGNAEHIYRNRVMHHGTLLFSSNLEMLATILYVDTDRYSDRAVKSVRADVTNLSDHLPKSMTTEGFAEFLLLEMKRMNPAAVDYVFNESDLTNIYQLIESKYSTWEWNFGYSPTYTIDRNIEDLQYGKISISIRVEKGIIVQMELTGSGLKISQSKGIRNFFEGKPHHQINLKNQIPLNIADLDLIKVIIESISA